MGQSFTGKFGGGGAQSIVRQGSTLHLFVWRMSLKQIAGAGKIIHRQGACLAQSQHGFDHQHHICSPTHHQEWAPNAESG